MLFPVERLQIFIPLLIIMVATKLGMAMATVVATAAAFEPNVIFNFTVPDTARFIRYPSSASPNDVNATLSSWATEFAVSQIGTDGATYGGGPSAHHGDASTDDSSINFVFVGSRAYVLGNGRGFLPASDSFTSRGAANISLVVSANGTNGDNTTLPVPTGDYLDDTGHLNYEVHAVNLTLPKGTKIAGRWTTTGVIITTGMKTEATSFDAAPMYVENAVINGTLNPRWGYDVVKWVTESPFVNVGEYRHT